MASPKFKVKPQKTIQRPVSVWFRSMRENNPFFVHCSIKKKLRPYLRQSRWTLCFVFSELRMEEACARCCEVFQQDGSGAGDHGSARARV
jgi:hypothetical protein